MQMNLRQGATGTEPSTSRGPALLAREAESAARGLSLLADRMRLRLLLRLVDGERKVGDLWRGLNVPQPMVSHHLALLLGAGLVSSRRDGQCVYYRLGDAVSSPSPGVIAFNIPPIWVRVERRRERRT